MLGIVPKCVKVISLSTEAHQRPSWRLYYRRVRKIFRRTQNLKTGYIRSSENVQGSYRTHYQGRSQEGGGRSAWGSAPNPGAASPRDRCWGLRPQTPAPDPGGFAARAKLGAPPPDRCWGSAPDPVRASHQKPGSGEGLRAEPPAKFLRRRSRSGVVWSPNRRGAPLATPLVELSKTHVLIIRTAQKYE